MLYFRACPRCQGDMITNRDVYGVYKVCLQCGHMVDLGKPHSRLSESAYRAKKKAA